jgi:ATP-dependent Lon protease
MQSKRGGDDGYLLDRYDFHIHIPAGATPKDGPSAGMAMAVSIVSLLTGLIVPHTIAMTGEISLHGDILPIGGVGEKIEAAIRNGMKKCIVPDRNHSQVIEWRRQTGCQEKLEVLYVSRVKECLNLVFGKDIWKRDMVVQVTARL